MVVLGTDAHKRSHMEVAADEAGVEVGSVTVAAAACQDSWDRSRFGSDLKENHGEASVEVPRG